MVIGLLSNLDSTTLANSIVTLVAAFSGAYFAFSFNQGREKSRKQEVDLASANKAIFVLIRSYNYVAGYNKQFIQPHKNAPEAYVAILPSLGNSRLEFTIDYDSISFLISKSKPEVLSELTEFEGLLSTITETMKARDHIHLNVVQPAMEKAGFVQGAPVELGEIDKILGDRTSTVLKSLTAELIDMTQHGESRCELLIQKLHDITTEIFPGAIVVKMEKVRNQDLEK